MRLRWLASARGKLRDVRRLMEVEADTGAASSTRPLLQQVLGKILLQVRGGGDVMRGQHVSVAIMYSRRTITDAVKLQKGSLQATSLLGVEE